MSEWTLEKNTELISVVIPTHNRRVTLERCLQSVLAQEAVDLEVVVVDDGSQDDTATWLATVGDPRVRVLRHEVALGVARARNAGIAAARGGWIAFLDDDDLWSPAKLRTQLDRARRDGAGLVYAGAVQVDGNGDVTAVLACPPPDDLSVRVLEHNVVPAGQSNILVRADVLARAGGFDDRLMHFADWDMWIRLAAETRCAASPEPLVAYVVHAGGMLVSGGGDKWREVEHIRRKHADRARRLGVRIGGDEFLGWMIWVHRRSGRRRDASVLFLRRGLRYRRPRDVARAIGVLFGERAMGFGRRPVAVSEEPAWLDRLRAPTRVAPPDEGDGTAP